MHHQIQHLILVLKTLGACLNLLKHMFINVLLQGVTLPSKVTSLSEDEVRVILLSRMHYTLKDRLCDVS